MDDKFQLNFQTEDKRDLFITFGIESRIKRKTFLNANSAFKKSLWNKINFEMM